MRACFASVLILLLAASAAALETGNRFIPPAKDNVSDNMADTREGGETYADAYVIPGDVPGDSWTDSGATCDNRDDITLTCGYGTAPDVVYQFSPPVDMDLTVDLCGSGYDTALEIQDGIGVPFMCNDDYCGLQSGFASVPFSAGHTYYFIVDGYSTNCGSYVFNITRCCGCTLPCPLGGVPEGEPECGDEYVDTYNGGCNSYPARFQPIWGDAEGTAILCGKSGTYTVDGVSYRDTDWFQVYGTGVDLTASLAGEFSSQLILIYNADCDYLLYDLATADMCEFSVLSRLVEAGTETWIWVGPSLFTGVPCDADYVLEVQGIASITSPVSPKTWGEIKGCFR